MARQPFEKRENNKTKENFSKKQNDLDSVF